MGLAGSSFRVSCRCSHTSLPFQDNTGAPPAPRICNRQAPRSKSRRRQDALPERVGTSNFFAGRHVAPHFPDLASEGARSHPAALAQRFSCRRRRRGSSLPPSLRQSFLLRAGSELGWRRRRGSGTESQRGGGCRKRRGALASNFLRGEDYGKWLRRRRRRRRVVWDGCALR